jgi:23S rRNA pseudoU1915 N3-methylase RlmH
MLLAASIVDVLHELDLKPSRILPSVEEGVAISFGKNDRYAVIEAYNDGALAVALTSDGKAVRSWEFADERQEIREVLEDIARHIA